MKQITGQTELFEEAKAPIMHLSLTHHWIECPKCHSDSGCIRDELVGHGRERHLETFQNDRCSKCGQLLDWSDEAIEKKKKMTRDYAEVEKLGLHGAVAKDDKGKWYEVHY